jgi:hypothetical protein
MFLNIRAYDSSGLIYEVNPYDNAAATLKGLTYPYQGGQGLPSPLLLVRARFTWMRWCMR